jgi:hypothetical protein
MRNFLTVLNFVKKLSVCTLVVIASFLGTDLLGENPNSIAIIGGQGDAPYAAVVRSDRSVMGLPGLPGKGLTYRVAMNSSGEGIIGGTEGLNAYAALVSRRGELTPIMALITPGEIYTVAIDESGKGIIEGGMPIPAFPTPLLSPPRVKQNPSICLRVDLSIALHSAFPKMESLEEKAR